MILRPVKVTAWLASPLALTGEGRPPQLDAICEWALASKMRTICAQGNGVHECDPTRRRGEPVDKPGQIPIPIAREMIDGLPIPRCSIGIFADWQQRHEHYSRRFPVELASLLRDDERTIVRASGGPLKSFRLPLRCVDVDRVVWFAALRESPSRLRMLLTRHVQLLGKKTSQGYGVVSKWEVEPAPEDQSWFAESLEGLVLMRPLPRSQKVSGLLGFREDFGAVTNPGWQRDFWVERIVPC